MATRKLFRDFVVFLSLSLLYAIPAFAEHPPRAVVIDSATAVRYMALGDSLAAGYKAIPATDGYVYRLYRDEVIAPISKELFCNAGVPGATSADVLNHQVPQALADFQPDVITLSVGGNDLLHILAGADAGTVLTQFQTNLTGILTALRTGLPQAKIYIGNLYTVPQIPGADQIVPVFNQILAQVATAFGVPVVDLYSAFLGRPELLLINQPGAAPDEVHPTNAGYRVMAYQFARVIRPDRRVNH